MKTFTKKGCKIAVQKKLVFGQILQGSGGYTTRIRRLYDKDQEITQKMITRLYNTDQEVMFSDTIIEPLQKTYAYKGFKITAHKLLFFSPANFAFLVSVLLSASVERCIVSRMRDFFYKVYQQTDRQTDN